MLTDDDKRWLTQQFDSLAECFTGRIEKLERLENFGSTLLLDFHKQDSPDAMRRWVHATVLRILD